MPRYKLRVLGSEIYLDKMQGEFKIPATAQGFVQFDPLAPPASEMIVELRDGKVRIWTQGQGGLPKAS